MVLHVAQEQCDPEKSAADLFFVDAKSTGGWLNKKKLFTNQTVCDT